MTRLPTPGGDDGNWGEILNTYLTTSLNADGTLKQIDKSKITGIDKVDNTADADKPVSDLTVTALGGKVDTTTTVNGQQLSSNVTVTKNDVGLTNVDNTTDALKPISTDTQSALDLKAGKPANVITVGASGCDFTTIQTAVDLIADNTQSDIIVMRGATYPFDQVVPPNIRVHYGSVNSNKKLTPVSNRSFIPDMTGTAGTTTKFTATDTVKGYTSYVKFTVPYACHGIQFEWHNEDRCGIPNSNAIIVKAQLTRLQNTFAPNGNTYNAKDRIPLRWSGATTRSIAGGERLLNDPMPVHLEAGETIWLAIYVSVVNTGEFIPGLFVDSTRIASTYDRCALTDLAGVADGTAFPTANGDIINPVTIQTKTVMGAGWYCDSYYTPLTMLGYFDCGYRQTLTIVGDSTSSGGVNQVFSGTIGNAGLPTINLQSPADKLELWYGDFWNSSNYSRWLSLGRSQIIISAIGRNSIPVVASIEAIKAKYRVFWSQLRGYGAKVYQTTLTPYTSTSSDWAHLDAQTLAGANAANIEACRIVLNAWFYSDEAAQYLDGVIPFAEAVQVVNSNGILVWKTGAGSAALTADGLHPNTAGRALMSVVIDSSVFNTA